jgi:hypothetical protein
MGVEQSRPRYTLVPPVFKRKRPLRCEDELMQKIMIIVFIILNNFYLIHQLMNEMHLSPLFACRFVEAHEREYDEAGKEVRRCAPPPPPWRDL